jgi:hypothetical protein
LREYTAACESDSESEGLQDFVVGDGDEESGSSSGGSGSDVEDARTLFHRQQNAELVVPADESAFFDAIHDEMEYSRLHRFLLGEALLGVHLFFSVVNCSPTPHQTVSGQTRDA